MHASPFSPVFCLSPPTRPWIGFSVGGQTTKKMETSHIATLSFMICKFPGTWQQGSSCPDASSASRLALPNTLTLSEGEVATAKPDWPEGEAHFCSFCGHNLQDIPNCSYCCSRHPALWAALRGRPKEVSPGHAAPLSSTDAEQVHIITCMARFNVHGKALAWERNLSLIVKLHRQNTFPLAQGRGYG